MKTPAKVQVDTMPADKYFAYAADLLKINRPHLTDEPIIARMKKTKRGSAPTAVVALPTGGEGGSQAVRFTPNTSLSLWPHAWIVSKECFARPIA
jgi:hypothetical protein